MDTLIITAANETQAEGYREQVAWRQACGLLPMGMDVLVVADPDGRRIGSLGATLNVLRLLARRTTGDPFKNRRILICHSGGDSRRTPAYAALGKAFAPLPQTTPEGQPLALFDLIFRHAEELPSRPGGQMIVVSGDVLITLDPKKLDFSHPGLTGVAWFDSPEQGARHGVYVADFKSAAKGVCCSAVTGFLQKPSEQAARVAGALDGKGREAVDTGILSFDPELCRTLLRFAQRESRALTHALSMDVYEELAIALARPEVLTTEHAEHTEEEFVRRFGKGNEQQARLVRSFWRTIAHTPFFVNVVPSCDFFHIGSSRELLSCLTQSDEKPTLLNSHLTVPVASVRALIEGSERTQGSLALGGNNIVTSLPGECTTPIRLPAETGLVCLPVGNKKWTAVAYHLDDNFKTDGLWTAKKWAVGTVDAAVKQALKALTSSRTVPAARSLVSMADLMPKINQKRLLAVRTGILQVLNRQRVAELVAAQYQLPTHPRKATIQRDQVVWASAPARIDFAGGWSDTPPICLVHGGTVLNVAVKLNGQYPIQAIAKLSDRPVIRITSIDLGISQQFTSTADFQGPPDPHDWCALAKEALVLAGIVPSQGGVRLSAWLKALGGGLDLTIFSALPKGSGLGTSSILGAVILACLERVQGIPFDAARLIRMTSALEQRLTTGGGWQDQIGGILPGIKLIQTHAGLDQTVTVHPVALTPGLDRFFHERCLLYFTGRKRMARTILQNVVDHYLAHDSQTLAVIPALKSGAERMRTALNAGQIQGFAAEVGEYWRLKKAIDPGSSTPEIERLLARLAPETCAVCLTGAAGGGFVFIVAKSCAAAKRIRARLEARPLNAAARFFNFEVDTAGLAVTVL